MRKYLWVLVALTLAISGCARGGADADPDALLALDREWSQTTKDIDKYMSYFAPDATAHAPNMPAIRGADAIRKTFTEMSQQPGFAVTWTAAKADVSGDVGYTTGAYEMSMAGAKETGKYVTVWKRQDDGSWKVVEDIFNADAAPQQASQHLMMPATDIKWGDPPPSLPPGSKIAVVSGDPTQPGPFVIRAMVPSGYRVAPHWHPGVESLTILTGTVALGMGETFDEGAMTAIGPGGYASLPAEMRHYFLAKSAATFQVHGNGPFVVNYVNPADDPSKAR